MKSPVRAAVAGEVGTPSDARPGEVVLTAEEVGALCMRAMEGAGFTTEEADIIAAHIVDAELCGYPALGLARALSIVEDPRIRLPRSEPATAFETAVSAMIDGRGHVGVYVMYRATEVAVSKTRAHGFALVGVHNTYYTGRNGYYLETIARAGFVGFHTACSEPYVVPLGGAAPALGTNPLAIALPCEPHPVVFDMSTSEIARSEVVLAARVDELLREGVAVDAHGQPTRDANAALSGGILTFGGHKGFGLAFMVQALGVLAGAAYPRGQVQDFGNMLIVFDPSLLMPADRFKQQLTALIDRVKSTPRRRDVQEIRIPSERAFRERERRRREGIYVARQVVERLNAT